MQNLKFAKSLFADEKFKNNLKLALVMNSDMSDSDEEVMAVVITLAEDDETLLKEQQRSRRAILSHKFNFNKHPSASQHWREMFRFGKNEILQLVHLFRLPNPIIVDRVTMKPEIAFCLFLHVWPTLIGFVICKSCLDMHSVPVGFGELSLKFGGLFGAIWALHRQRQACLQNEKMSSR
ncbi:hypothetical protein BC829DRAFT_401865 [Chytridium lagenaria]|nr:hypothetical protein BC829DRAFT_401865 [Chytridium lagenaria]